MSLRTAPMSRFRAALLSQGSELSLQAKLAILGH